MNALTEQQLLHDQVITEDSPGTILRDFEMLLDFIGPKGIPAGGKKTILLPMKCLSEINARLSHPLDIGLKRPFQKSYSSINGLYLLLRATALVDVKRVGKKQFLVLDQGGLTSWRSLNPSERYFTLLGAWLFQGKPYMLGEDRTMAHPMALQRWSEFYKQIPAQGLRIAGNKSQEDMIPYYPGLYHIALLELFGLLSVQHGKPKAGEGWRIVRVQRTALGDALLQLLSEPFLRIEFILELLNDGSKGLPRLQQVVQPYFPEWRETLAKPKAE